MTDLRESPTGSPPTDPSLPNGAPRRTPPVTVAVLLSLVVSMLLNGALALRLRDQQNEAEGLRAQLDSLEEDLETLRGRVRGSGSGDPLGRIAGSVEQLRGLRFKRTVAPELLSPAKFRDRVRRTVLDNQERDEIESTQKVLVAFGLLDPKFDLYEELVEVQQEQVVGFYDTDKRELVVAASDAQDPSPFDRVILAHEYTHALTDQHFDLRTLDKLQDRRRDDEATAYLALVEGDATLTMSLYQDQVLTADEKTRFFTEAGSISTESLTDLPEFLRTILEFPYTRGLEFVQALHRRGGFDLVDDAYRDPPESTEQILHPGSRFLDRRDDPVTVSLPDVRRALGAGWREIDEGELGELDVRVIVDQFLPFSDARDAGAGWDGGRYTALESSKGTVVAAVTAWDSPSEARQATDLLAGWLPKRYGSSARPFTVGGDGRGSAGDDGAGMVVRGPGDRVLLILGPDQDSVQRARGAFSGF